MVLATEHEGPRLAEPKLFFIHIPKTGGTTLYQYARLVLGESAVVSHAESVTLPEPSADMLRDLATKAFVGGHVPYDIFNNYFRPLGFSALTVLREPLQQFVSHVSYIARTEVPGPLLLGIQTKIAVSLNFFLKEANVQERAFFTSPQSNMLFSGNSGWRALEIAERVKLLYRAFGRILFCDSLGDTVGLLFPGRPKPSCPVLNRSPVPHLVLTSDDETIVREWIAADLALYSAISNTSSRQGMLRPPPVSEKLPPK